MSRFGLRWTWLVAVLLPTAALAAGETTMIDPSAMDTTVNPCEDFYGFACGGWIRRAEIPADRARWTRSFSVLEEQTEARLHDLLKNQAKGKLADLFESCMDEQAAEKRALPQLKSELKSLRALSKKSQLLPLVASMHMKGINVFFGMGSEQDAKDATMVIAGVDQGGLSLPERDYYLSEDPQMEKIRKLYLAHIQKMFELEGVSSSRAENIARTVMDLETKLARNSMSKEERRDPQKVYHRLDRLGLERLTPQLDWAGYFKALGYPGMTMINVANPDFFVKLETLLRETPLKDLRAYLAWWMLSSSSPALGSAFVNEVFQFRSKAFSGQPKLQDRWKRCVDAADAFMGEALSPLYIQQYFAGDSKKAAREVVARLEEAFEQELKELQWMDSQTLQMAQAKLHKIVNKIGFPDRWRDYAGVEIDRGSYFRNRVALNIFNNKFDLDRIGKPLDRARWDMTPTTINAYYSPEMNEIVFPAGILQRPFFELGADLASNLGALGMVVGHELTHGFDDQGRQYDGVGNLADWWSPESSKRFDERVGCVIRQYNGYTVLDGLHLNGEFTQGENLADIGGIRLAYRAFRNAIRDLPPQKPVAGLNQDQQFFVAFAQSWCTKIRPEAQRAMIAQDPHSPAQFRVNGPLSDLPAFGQAFGCKPGSPMMPDAACQVW